MSCEVKSKRLIRGRRERALGMTSLIEGAKAGSSDHLSSGDLDVLVTSRNPSEQIVSISVAFSKWLFSDTRFCLIHSHPR